MGSTQWYYLSNNPNALERSSEQKVECLGEVGSREKERERGRDKRGRPREADKPHSPAQPASAHQGAAASPSGQSPVREGKKQGPLASSRSKEQKGPLFWGSYDSKVKDTWRSCLPPPLSHLNVQLSQSGLDIFGSGFKFYL